MSGNLARRLNQLTPHGVHYPAGAEQIAARLAAFDWESVKRGYAALGADMEQNATPDGLVDIAPVLTAIAVREGRSAAEFLDEAERLIRERGQA